MQPSISKINVLFNIQFKSEDCIYAIKLQLQINNSKSKILLWLFDLFYYSGNNSPLTIKF